MLILASNSCAWADAVICICDGRTEAVRCVPPKSSSFGIFLITTGAFSPIGRFTGSIRGGFSCMPTPNKPDAQMKYGRSPQTRRREKRSS